MSIQIPRFIAVLHLAKVAYELGREEYNGRRNLRREFDGALPKRREASWITCARVAKKALSSVPGILSEPERRVVLGSYDQGLADEHYAREKVQVAS